MHFLRIVHGDADISSIESSFYIPLSTIITGLGNHAHATVFVHIVRITYLEALILTRFEEPP